MLSEAAFKIAPGRWAGPFRSGFGWHLVYVVVHDPVRIADFTDVRDIVRRDYVDWQRRVRNAETYENLKKQFTIVRE